MGSRGRGEVRHATSPLAINHLSFLSYIPFFSLNLYDIFQCRYPHTLFLIPLPLSSRLAYSKSLLNLSWGSPSDLPTQRVASVQYSLRVVRDVCGSAFQRQRDEGSKLPTTRHHQCCRHRSTGNHCSGRSSSNIGEGPIFSKTAVMPNFPRS